MLISLNDDGILVCFDENFASFINFGTFPISNVFFTNCIGMSFSILEAMLILHYNWISHSNTWKEGSIDQDFIISWNIIFNLPVVFCKNKSISRMKTWVVFHCFLSCLYTWAVWLCSFLWTVMISPAILMETLQPLFLLKHVQCWKCFASWVLRYLKPSSSWILTEFPTAWIWKKGLLTKISFSFRTTSSLLQLSSARRNKVREWRQSCIQNFISFL